MSNTERFRVDEVEYLLLGAAHSDTAAMATIRPRLRPEDFGFGPHGRLWAAFCDLFDGGRPIEAAGLAEALKRRNAYADVSVSVRLSPMVFMRASVEHVESWCKMVTANARARRVVSALSACSGLVGDESVGPEDFVSTVREEITGSSDDGDIDGECWLEDAMQELQLQLEATANGQPGVAYWPTGLDQLDQMIGGLRSGQVTLFAGKTGGGKTALAITTAMTVAFVPKAKPLLFVSLEMLAEDMAARAAAYVTAIPQASIRDAQVRTDRALGHNDLQVLSLAGRKVAKKIRLLCRGDVTVAEIKARAQRMQAREGLSIVIVDYLQLVKPATKNNQNREREVADISRGLKAMAMELHVPVVALSQLNRDADDRETPSLSNIRESGAMAQDASSVVFIWPPKNADDKDGARIIVAKSRFGPTGEFDARFHRAFSRFEDPVGEVVGGTETVQ